MWKPFGMKSVVLIVINVFELVLQRTAVGSALNGTGITFRFARDGQQRDGVGCPAPVLQDDNDHSWFVSAFLFGECYAH